MLFAIGALSPNGLGLVRRYRIFPCQLRSAAGQSGFVALLEKNEIDVPNVAEEEIVKIDFLMSSTAHCSSSVGRSGQEQACVIARGSGEEGNGRSDAGLLLHFDENGEAPLSTSATPRQARSMTSWSSELNSVRYISAQLTVVVGARGRSYSHPRLLHRGNYLGDAVCLLFLKPISHHKA